MFEFFRIKLWVAGRYMGEMSSGHASWGFKGIFFTRKQALKMCSMYEDFIVPVCIGSKDDPFVKTEYPLSEDREEPSFGERKAEA